METSAYRRVRTDPYARASAEARIQETLRELEDGSPTDRKVADDLRRVLRNGDRNG